MTPNNKPTEQLFKDAFADFQKTPSDKVWTGVKKGIFFNNIQKLLSFIVAGVAVLVTVFVIYSLSSSSNLNKTKLNKTKLNKISTQENTQELLIQEIDYQRDMVISAPEKELTVKKIHSANKNYRNNVNTSKKQNPQNIQHKIIAPTVVPIINVYKQEPVLEDSTQNILQIPDANFTISKHEGCVPFTIHLKSKNNENTSSTWDFGNGQNSQGNEVNYTYNEAGEYTVKHTVVNTGIVNTKTLKIKVHEQPKADFMVEEPKNIHVGGKTIFTNLSTGSVRSEWSFGDGSRTNEINPTHSYAKKGMYDVKLKVFSEKNCIDSSTIENLIVKHTKYNIQFPNAFTPSLQGPVSEKYYDNDISNNLFHPVNVKGVSRYKLTIYNKKGIILFETTDYTIGWNGYYKNRLMKQGVYIYVCNGQFTDGEYFNKSGNITLIHVK